MPPPRDMAILTQFAYCVRSIFSAAVRPPLRYLRSCCCFPPRFAERHFPISAFKGVREAPRYRGRKHYSRYSRFADLRCETGDRLMRTLPESLARSGMEDGVSSILEGSLNCPSFDLFYFFFPCTWVLQRTVGSFLLYGIFC